ncbi:MAG: LPS O-antigen length regulator [Gammaproteobacteria bacterium]|nr:MAG: LPS O-antigen length regulator [Gammaproteobacteria bacterium]
MPEKNKHLEQENAELKAQVKALSTLNPALYTGVNDDSDEIDLAELWRAIWSGKWLIVAITSIFALTSVLYALNLPDEYKSTVLLAPASSSSSSSLSKLAGQFGGLASLAGINLGGGGAEDKTVVAMEIMKTWGFLETFIKDNHIEVEVFAAEGWNRSSNSLVIDPEVYDVDNKKWVREFNASRGQKIEPSSWELFEKFKGRVSVSQDKTSGLISLSVEYFSPIIAKQWTDKLVKAINAHIQKQDREEAIKSIAYLNDKIKETNIADMQSVFYQLIEEQTKTLMLAEVSDEYVFKTLSPAKVAEEKAKPKRALIVILGLMLGGMLAVIIVLIRHFKRNNATNPKP